MKDVAIAARVSLKTVSRAVNGEPGVTPGTGQRGVTRSRRSVSAATTARACCAPGRPRPWGLVREDIGDPFHSALSSGMERVARSRGSLLLSGSSDADPATEH
jgi:LacI family transcriptional regulator